ncbi:MAG: hypothetical protein ABWY64_13295 [Tardiphaga sp.]
MAGGEQPVIVHTSIGGRPATVAYLHSDWTLAGKDDADFLKVIFADGDVLFLKPATAAVTDFNPDPNWTKGPDGKFTGSEPGAGGGEGGSAEAKSLNPRVAKVGGDSWNKATAVRLERHYQSVKEDVDKTLKTLIAEGLAVPRAWEALTPAQQEETRTRYRQEMANKGALSKTGTPEEMERFTATAWERMPAESKFYYANQYGTSGARSFVPLIEEPKVWDPLQQKGGEDYQRTQLISHHLSERRAMERLAAKGLPSEKGYVRAMDQRMWTGWVESSTSDDGLILQLAAAEALGGRYRAPNTVRTNSFTRDQLITMANDRYSLIGGYAGVQEMLLAKWETTQYLLDKGGVDTFDVYRALSVAGIGASIESGQQPYEEVGAAMKLDIDLMRNGAQSASMNTAVTNGWDGNKDRVVVRIAMPRTAAISIPAYGDNEFEEREVVVTGTAWRGWDAWYRGAPEVEKIPIEVADAYRLT